MIDDEMARATRARRANPFLNSQQAAEFLRLSHRHLQRMRSRGQGPQFRRHSRYVWYHVDDLIRWSESTSGRPFHA